MSIWKKIFSNEGAQWAGILISLIVGVISCHQTSVANKLARATAHLHVRPQIVPVLPQTQPGVVGAVSNGFLVALVNTGPVVAKAVCADCRFVFFQNGLAPGFETNAVPIGVVGPALAQDTLAIAEPAYLQVPIVRPRNPFLVTTNPTAGAAELMVQYYRETDREKFTDTFYFLIEGEQIVGPKSFALDPRYSELLKVFHSKAPPAYQLGD